MTARIKPGLSFLLGFLIIFLSPKIIYGQVIISEFIPNPEQGKEKVEIQNIGNQAVSLVNWQIDDIEIGGQNPKSFSTEIAANGFYVIDLESTAFLNNNGDSVRLLDDISQEKDKKDYLSCTEGLSWARDSSGSWCEQEPSFGSENESCSSVIPTSPFLPTPTSTSTPTPQSTSDNKATYLINEVKNEEEEVLSNVRVYLDGEYLHHYAPEELTFCDDCDCDGYAACGFGEHRIRLEKSGYENWEETEIISAGDNYEVNPVMRESDSESGPTPTLTPTPSPKLTLTPTLEKTPTPGGEVLGESRETYLLESPTPSPEASGSGQSGRFLPVIFLISGAVFLFSGGLWVWYRWAGVNQGEKNEEEEFD